MQHGKAKVSAPSEHTSLAAWKPIGQSLRGFPVHPMNVTSRWQPGQPGLKFPPWVVVPWSTSSQSAWSRERLCLLCLTVYLKLNTSTTATDRQSGTSCWCVQGTQTDQWPSASPILESVESLDVHAHLGQILWINSITYANLRIRFRAWSQNMMLTSHKRDDKTRGISTRLTKYQINSWGLKNRKCGVNFGQCL